MSTVRTKLKNICEVYSGYAFSSKSFQNVGLPVIKIRNLTPPTVNLTALDHVSQSVYQNINKPDRYHINPGDILIALTGATIGKVSRMPRGTKLHLLNQRVGKVVLTDPTQADYNYLYYLISNPIFVNQMIGMASGSAQANLSPRRITDLPVILPPLDEQKRIAHILGSFDDKIELNRKMNETLEAMAQALFKDWFVDFGPTRAKMEGKEPYLAPELWDLFPDTLDENGVPEGWEKSTFGEIAQPVGSQVDPGSVAADMPYIGLAHMPRNSLALTDWDVASSVTSGKVTFKKHDVLFGKLRPYFHKVGVASVDGIASTDIVVLNAKDRKYHSFVVVLVSSASFVEYTNLTSSGTKMPRTSWRTMSQYPMIIPNSQTIITKFENQVSPLITQILSNVTEMRALDQAREVLLQNLFK